MSDGKDILKQEHMEPADCLSREELTALQLARLQQTVRHAYDHVELFRKRMQERGLTPEDVRSMDDLSRLPFSMKADLRDCYPFGLFAVPMKEVIRLHASSGTTGKPIVVGYTKEDIELWAGIMRRAFRCCGLSSDDVIQISYGYGLFTGGLGAHYGTEALGATVVPASGGNTQRQIMVMKDFGVTAICCTPSYFNYLCEKAQEEGVDMHALPLKIGIFGAEPWSNGMRAQIRKNSGIEPFDIYGLSELIGPGVAIECKEHNGLHIFEDHFYPEIINPETGEVLPDGEFGELVLTSLTKRALPMIRYRTRDLTRILPGRCACGRTLRRIDRISSRSDDMFIIRGVNVFPSQIEAALLSVEGIKPYYQIELSTVKGLDSVDVKVELTEEMFSDTIGSLETLQKRLSAAVEHTLGLRVGIKLVPPFTLERTEGKSRRVIDNRKKD